MTSAENATELPLDYGVILFPTFQALDVFGPLDTLNLLSFSTKANLHITAEKRDPVSTAPWAALNKAGSVFGESVVPTHTFEDLPKKLDVLLIPGRFGTQPSNNLDGAIKFVRATYPKLKYLITVCTEAWIAAQAGVMDHKKATTNKELWDQGTKFGKGTHWVAKARWVKCGNIYSTSGVSAGTDGALAFISDVHGEEKAKGLAAEMEYNRMTDPSQDQIVVGNIKFSPFPDPNEGKTSKRIARKYVDLKRIIVSMQRLV